MFRINYWVNDDEACSFDFATREEAERKAEDYVNYIIKVRRFRYWRGVTITEIKNHTPLLDKDKS